MKNNINLLQGVLISVVLTLVGYSLKTIEFWIVLLILFLQWIKEDLYV